MRISKDQAVASLLVALCLITLGNAALSAWNYYHFKGQVRHEHREFRNVTTTNCEEIELVKEAVRATIEQAQRFTKSSPVRSSSEKKLSEEYYTAVLKRFKAKDCRGGDSSSSKNSSKRSSATPRPSRSGKPQSSTSSSGPASSPSSTVPTTR